eukprot:PhM_4_TR15796/c0_g1_i1/m.43738
MNANRRRPHPAESKFTLNPELEEEDQKQVALAMKEDATREAIESLWQTVLSHGDPFVQQKCTSAHFKHFVRGSGMDPQLGVNVFETFCSTTDETLDLTAFVRCLFHYGLDKYKTTDYTEALTRTMGQHGAPYDTSVRLRNDSDGTNPSASFFSIAELDRVLYIYDGVFDRMFNMYRAWDTHGYRDLNYEQTRLLDNYMELEELKEFAKDFGLFPKFVSYVELSKAAQCAAWGAVLVDPQKQAMSRTSALEDKSKKEKVGGKKEPVVESPLESPLSGIAVNPLISHVLPDDMKSEVLMEKSHFMDAFIRIAQMLYTRPEYKGKYPTITCRVEELLRLCEAPYEKVLSRKMLQDCDFVEPGIPVLLNTGPGAALYPQTGVLAGGFDLAISGANFCEKRNVFVRFGAESSDVVVRCSSVTRKKVSVVVPAFEYQDVLVEVSFDRKIYFVQISRVADIRVECSNNRFDFSDTEPEQRLKLRTPSPKFEIDEATLNRMLKYYAMLCSVEDKYNTKFMNRGTWKRFKKEFGVVEKPYHNVSSVGVAEDPFFLDVAEGHDARGDVCVDFRGFLRVLTRCAFEMVGTDDSATYNKIKELLTHEPLLRQKKVEEHKVAEDEMTRARQLIENTEQRVVREFDIYSGPVLCGTLTDRPGAIQPMSGAPRRHAFVTYVQHDGNSQDTILNQIAMSESFVHLLSRLRAAGYELGAPATSIKTRMPYGRCWSISRRNDGEKIGVVWDYPGNMCSPTWLPVSMEAFNENFCVTLYLPPDSVDFVVMYMMFSRAKDIAQLRTMLTSKQYVLRTVLFKA